MSDQQARIVAYMKRLAPHEGYTASLLDGVNFMRADRPLGRTPVLYEPSIVLVCSGRKRGFLGDEVYVYDANHYLVLSVPLPFSTQTEASEQEPLLAVSLRLDPTITADLMLATDSPDRASIATPKSIYSTPMDTSLSGALLRLLEALSSPLEAQVLAPLVMREICFRVLTGEQGDAMRAALAHQGHFAKIAKALRRIHANFDHLLDVNTLARDSGMSAAAFHAHFKAVTQTSPMQYLKSIRLHQARLMMIRNGLTAAAASTRVGYESASQFSREFKRLFGRTPLAEAAQMKVAFGMSGPVQGPPFAQLH